MIVFPELDVRSIIREIRPDIHAKGTDYTADTVPERDVVADAADALPSSAIQRSLHQRNYPLAALFEEILIDGQAARSSAC